MFSSGRRIPLLAMLLIAGGCTASTGTRLRGIDNFAVVDPGAAALYRGAQPSGEGWGTLAEMGVKTVIDLRDDPVPAEQGALAHAGIRYVQIPWSAGAVDPRRVATFLERVRSEPRPIFVHCRLGCDRTGLEIAAYRIVEQGWSRGDAIKELHAHGYHWMFFPGIERYLRTFDPGAFRAPDNVARAASP
jgi:tyrosine-protein phosphatase SIW14